MVRKQIWFAPLLFWLIVSTNGCGMFDDAIDRALQRIDRLIETVEGARITLKGESRLWGERLDALAAELQDSGADMIARDLRHTIEHSIDKAGIELRCNMDFVGAKLDKNLENILAALRQKRQEIEATGKLNGTVDALIGSIEFVPEYLPPYVCDATPRLVRLARVGGRVMPINNHEVIDYTGFGLKNPPNADWKPVVAIVGADGTERDLGSEVFASVSPYVVQVNLQLIAHHIRRGDVKLALKLGTQRHELVLIFDEPTPGPLTKSASIGEGTTLPVQLAHRSNGGNITIYGDAIPVMSAKDFEKKSKYRTVGGPMGHPNLLYPHRDRILAALRQTWPSRYGQSVRVLPVPAGGDRDFGGNPLMTVETSIHIHPDKSKLVATARSYAVEWQRNLVSHDFTFGSGWIQATIPLPESLAKDWDIVGINSDASSACSVLMYRQDDTLAFSTGELVSSIQVFGDRKGEDLGVFTRAVVKLQPIHVQVARKGQYRLVLNGGKSIVVPKERYKWVYTRGRAVGQFEAAPGNLWRQTDNQPGGVPGQEWRELARNDAYVQLGSVTESGVEARLYDTKYEYKKSGQTKWETYANGSWAE